MKVKSLSRIRLFATPWTAAYRAPPSITFSRQEYWSGLPLPSPSSPAPQLKSVSSSALSLLYGPTMYMRVCMLICFVSNSLQSYGLLLARLLWLWDSPGRNSELRCHPLLQGILPTKGSNPCLSCLLHWQAGSLLPAPPGSPHLYTGAKSNPGNRVLSQVEKDSF